MHSKPDEPMRIGQISIERQRLPTLSDTFGSAVCPNLNRAKEHMSSGMVRYPQQHVVERLLRGPEMSRSVVGHERRADRQIDVSCINCCFNIFGIEHHS